MSGPLSGLKVLDFSTLLPGPCATMMLADMGAEVLRVESPTRLDLLRAMPPRVEGMSAAHAYLNRGKASVALDLKKPSSVAVVHRLLEEYDILVEQFRPGVMQKLGLGYETLSEMFPRLIYCSITGYGQTGPYARRAGHDINYLALSGASSYAGRAKGGPPPLGVQVADVAGGSHHAVMAVLAAVIDRHSSDQGQWLDISMTDAAFVLNHMSLAGFLAGEAPPEAESTLLNGAGVYDYYQTKDERYLAIGSLEPQFAQGLCQALGLPQLASRILSQTESDRQYCKAEIAGAIGRKTLAEWVAVFEPLDVCVEPVLNLQEAIEHPQIQARELIQSTQLPGGALLSQPASPLRFSRHPRSLREPGHDLGQDTRSVLQSLGYDENQINGLQQEGVFGRLKP